MRHLLALALVILAAASATAQGRPLTYSAPEIKARIVDEQSGAPLGGVVVFAKWTLITEIPGAGGGHNFNNQHEFETTTDPDGWLVIPAWGPELRAANTYLTKDVPEFRIFKAGYFPRFLANDRYVDPESAIVTSDWNGRIIALKPFDGDWRRYAQLLRALWAAHPWQCRRSCPRLIFAVYEEWPRIVPSLSPEIRRSFGPPPPFRSLPVADRMFLEQFRDARQDAK